MTEDAYSALLKAVGQPKARKINGTVGVAIKRLLAYKITVWRLAGFRGKSKRISVASNAAQLG